MKKLAVDFANALGNVEIMNAVNNGPAGSKVRGTGNYAAYLTPTLSIL